MVEKRRERQRVKVPLVQWPTGKIAIQIRLQERLQLRVVQRAGLELLRRPLGGQRLSLEASATRQQEKNSRLDGHGFHDTHVPYGPVCNTLKYNTRN